MKHRSNAQVSSIYMTKYYRHIETGVIHKVKDERWLVRMNDKKLMPYDEHTLATQYYECDHNGQRVNIVVTPRLNQGGDPDSTKEEYK